MEVTVDLLIENTDTGLVFHAVSKRALDYLEERGCREGRYISSKREHVLNALDFFPPDFVAKLQLANEN